MSQPTLPWFPTGRVPELDGLRGVAVLMVLAWHVVGVMVDPAAGAWEFWVYHALRMGRTGVDLFFVLSGFLITGIVLDRQRPASQFLLSFYLRRSLRILPPYLAVVAIFWLLVAAGMNNRGVNGDMPIWYHLTFTQNWWMAAHNTLGPYAMAITWSVAIEEQYYLIAPLVLLVLPPRWVPAALLLTAAASALFRAWLGTESATILGAYILTPARLDGLALGGLLAWLWRQPAAHAWIVANARGVARLTRWGILSMAVLVAFAIRNLDWHMSIWGHACLAGLATLVVVVVLLRTGTTRTRPLRNAGLRFVGSISYSLYLFHPCIIGMAVLLCGHKPVASEWRDWLVMLGALSMTLAVCTASMALVERRLMLLGRRFRY